MASLGVTAEDLRQYLPRVEWSADRDALAEVLLSGAQGEIEANLNRPIGAVEVEEIASVELPGPGLPTFTPSPVDARQLGLHVGLRRTPVKSVSWVQRYDGPDAEAGPEMTIVGTTSYGVLVSGLWLGTPLIEPGGQVKVKYLGGIDLAEAPEVKDLILRGAARRMHRYLEDAQSLTSLSSDGYSASWEPETLKKEELKAISRWRKRVVR